MKKLKFVLIFLLAALTLLTLFGCSGEQIDQKEVLVVTLSSKNIYFTQPGETYTLYATAVPEDAENTGFTWSSTDTDIATVDNGVVTAVGWGVCVIRASASNGVSATAIVLVGSSRPTLSLSETTLIFQKTGESQTLIPHSEGAGVTAEELSWFSSNKKIATCENGVVTAHGYGICTITARAENGITAECMIIVEEPDNAYCYISDSELFFSSIDERRTVTASVSNDATMKINWLTSNPEIATVEGGVIRTTGFGSCAVIAIAENGLSAACVVRVGEEENYNNPFTHQLSFYVAGLPCNAKFVNRETGQIESIATIISAKISVHDRTTIPDLPSDDVLGVIIELKCVKTFDINGLSGKKSAAITASVYYTEDGKDNFGTSQILREPDRIVGEEFTRTVRVVVRAIPNETRHFFLSIDEYTIL